MTTTLSPDAALEKLLEGNRHFVAGNMVRPHQSPARRIEVADSQSPFACILGCSDSRVPPEVIFDQGLGDLYVIRVAGHLPDPIVLSSLDHAVNHLHIPLVMVLGHQNCGAVQAALEGDPGGHLARLTRALQPAIHKVKSQPTLQLDSAIRANVEIAVRALKLAESPLAKPLAENRLRLEGAYYDLSSGTVVMLT